jgi:hypothetical protein
MMNAALFFAGLLVVSGAPTPSPAVSSPPDMKNLLVYGDHWGFFTREPDGWTGHTERSGEIGSNVFFLHTGESLEQNGSLIRVSIEPKDDTTVERDLAADMARFKKSEPDVQFADFQADYPGGSVFAKIYRRSNGDEYVAYVDAAPGAKVYFIVSYDPPVRESATEADLNAYRAVITSLKCCISSVLQNSPPPATPIDERGSL